MIINGSSKISGVGIHLPDERVSSVSLMEEIQADKRFGIPLNWVDKRIGIVERRFATSESRPSDLATEAAINALEQSGVEPNQLDLILYAGIEKDFMEPATAHVVQNKLGAPNATCADVSNACQGVISGMAFADSLIAGGSIDTALICAGEQASKVVKSIIQQINDKPDDFFRDRFGAMTVGDAGSAVVLTRADTASMSGIRTMHFNSMGEYADFCFYRWGVHGVDGQMLMKGITDKINEIHQDMITDMYRDLAWQPDEVDYMICHQVGKKSVRDFCNISQVPIERTPLTYIYLGNTASCSIPIALNFADANQGDKLFLMGGGSGLANFQGGIVW